MLGAENDEPEISFRRGYQQGAIDIFLAIERCLDPTTREVLQAWIEKDEGDGQPPRLLVDLTGPA